MRGDERAELAGYDFSSISCLGSIYVKPDQTVKTAASGIFVSCLDFHSNLS